MSRTKRCCCNTPGCECELTKEASGLPDTLTISIAKTSSSDTGMPADGEPGECGERARWRHSDALIDLLGSIPFEYVERSLTTECGCCCFRYVSTGDYEPECGTLGDGWMLFGASPFSPTVIGEHSVIERFEGPTDGNNVEAEPYENCCPRPSELDCSACGTGFSWSEGTLTVPLPIYGKAEALICIDGNTATICLAVTMIVPCKVYYAGVGGCSYSGYSLPSGTGGGYPGDCTVPPHGPFCSGDPEESCGYQTVGITFHATADLTGVEGETPWEKIQNATFEESDYEYAACTCALDGCNGSQQEILCGCSILPNCGCISHEIGNPFGNCAESFTEGAPVDTDCIYSVGTAQLNVA